MIEAGAAGAVSVTDREDPAGRMAFERAAGAMVLPGAAKMDRLLVAVGSNRAKSLLCGGANCWMTNTARPASATNPNAPAKRVHRKNHAERAGADRSKVAAGLWRRSASPRNKWRVASCRSNGPPSARRLNAWASSSSSIGCFGSSGMGFAPGQTGFGGEFFRENNRRAIPSSRSRHLLRRELTVFTLSPSSPEISS
jgi:hypothetical protein